MTAMTDGWPVPPGAATGIGSLPGTDPVEAAKLVFGELPDLPHLPELPDRGPGADLVGRGAGLLVDLAVELYAGQWRLAARPGRDRRRTRDLLERDLDALTEAGNDYSGPIKVQVAGPWTLSAGVDLPVGGRVLRDHGACRDLADSLAEGVRAHVAEVARRLPAASVLLQIDEPSLPAVLAGAVPTESGLHTYRAVSPSVAASTLRGVVVAADAPVVVHCCAAAAPLQLIRDAGARAVSVDLDRLASSVAELDPLAEVLDAGLGLVAGCVPATMPPAGQAPTGGSVAGRIEGLWRILGLPPELMARRVVVAPACGLAGASPAYARAALAACVEAGRRLAGDSQTL